MSVRARCARSAHRACSARSAPQRAHREPGWQAVHSLRQNEGEVRALRGQTCAPLEHRRGERLHVRVRGQARCSELARVATRGRDHGAGGDAAAEPCTRHEQRWPRRSHAHSAHRGWAGRDGTGRVRVWQLRLAAYVARARAPRKRVHHAYVACTWWRILRPDFRTTRSLSTARALLLRARATRALRTPRLSRGCAHEGEGWRTLRPKCRGRACLSRCLRPTRTPRGGCAVPQTALHLAACLR